MSFLPSPMIDRVVSTSNTTLCSRRHRHRLPGSGGGLNLSTYTRRDWARCRSWHCRPSSRYGDEVGRALVEVAGYAPRRAAPTLWRDRVSARGERVLRSICRILAVCVVVATVVLPEVASADMAPGPVGVEPA
jgi:hypothetical protein